MYTVLSELLDRAFARRACEALAALPLDAWDDGRDSAGPQARQVKSNLQLAHDHPLAEQVRQEVLQALDKSEDFLSRALPAKIFTPRINRYDPDHPAYGWHIDQAIRLRADGQHVRTDLSCTVLLNDPQDYDGGELAVRDGDVEHDVKLRAGDAILYPSGLVHEVRPVTRGARLACFFWIQSLVPGDHERRVLHDLDRNLTALRSRQGESDETVALVGVYHNLLRLWSR